MFGAHNSISGGLHHAVEEAVAGGMDCLQLFTKNQRQWAVKPLVEAQVSDFRAALESAGWGALDEAWRLVSHDSYLINLASDDAAVRGKSLALMREEIERCEALGIPSLVAHPGSHLGKALKPGQPFRELDGEPAGDELAGLERIAAALDQLHRELPGYRTVTCLESTAGQGTNLGYSFTQLAWLRAHVEQPERIGYCLDTCHLHAAGYDLGSEQATLATLERFDALCGLDQLRVVHLNDAKEPRGTRKDRHEHLGHGEIGLPAFEAIVNHPRLQAIPMIIETAKQDDWDAVNLGVLRDLKRA